MTNYEKLINDGPEALVNLIFKESLYCTASIECIHLDCSNCLRNWLNNEVKHDKSALSEDEEIFCRWAVIFGFRYMEKKESGVLSVHKHYPISAESKMYYIFANKNMEVGIPPQYPFLFIPKNTVIDIVELLGDRL